MGKGARFVRRAHLERPGWARFALLCPPYECFRMTGTRYWAQFAQPVGRNKRSALRPTARKRCGEADLVSPGVGAAPADGASPTALSWYEYTVATQPSGTPRRPRAWQPWRGAMRCAYCALRGSSDVPSAIRHRSVCADRNFNLGLFLYTKSIRIMVRPLNHKWPPRLAIASNFRLGPMLSKKSAASC